jgi:hypothetical protein
VPFPNPATQFKKGNPGGPGRPKTGVLSKILNEILADADDADARAIVRALVDEAKHGSIAHIKEIFDRVEGKPTESKGDEGHGAKVAEILDDDIETNPA